MEKVFFYFFNLYFNPKTNFLTFFIAQQNPIQANLALLQNPNQLAAAMAQATVVAAQHSMNQGQVPVAPSAQQNSPNKTRPSSVGPGSGCHTSDAISE
jgi:hypothetical protein